MLNRPDKNLCRMLCNLTRSNRLIGKRNFAITASLNGGMMPSFNLNDSIQKTRNAFKMGGKIGMETLIKQEQFYLAEYVAHESKQYPFGIISYLFSSIESGSL